MRYESPRRWLLGPASTDADGLGHSRAWLIGPSGATLGRRPDYSITSSARASSVGGMVRRSILAVSALRTSSNLLAHQQRVRASGFNCREGCVEFGRRTGIQQ